ncbi:cupin domain-containing protein [Amylibacter sp. IMCC11727]|uniref:cupin domain-containing protein n=1 Tax=Amylibacter sp. IMCC11727 TaxID=3039851 RepID=UPI00244DF28F|nr:cupin domain-containing protein [Amylibacter sp. IMCC11727]WGI22710.1 cupin domain-containing protein [Amylibacter sp. IMCC11727]
MPKIDLDKVPQRSGSSYPDQYSADTATRTWLPVAEHAGLTQFGANLVSLVPGAKSSLRHWHAKEDEFLIVTEGTPTLIEDDGETLLHPGDCAAFKAGVENGHHLVNTTDQMAKFLVVGTSHPEEICTYSDIDMKVTDKDGESTFTRKDGTPID